VEGRILSIDGHQLVYLTAGDQAAPALIFVHGWNSHKRLWASTIEAFQHSHYCVAIDLLGFGESDKPRRADYSLPGQGRRVLALADALGIDQFVLAGHSMGGQIALAIAALLAPDRVRQVISVDGVVMGRANGEFEQFVIPLVIANYYAPVITPVVHRLAQIPVMARYMFRHQFHRIDSVPFDAWREDRHLATQPGIHHGAFHSLEAIRALDMRPHLPALKCPALAIFGAHDRVVEVDQGRLIEQLAPQGRLAVIDDCGHLPMLEKPEAYLAILRDFIGQTAETPGGS
jgi:pimeloyl-ACP methyl ester carboxylesterase